jgi:hypothetical protein
MSLPRPRACQGLVLVIVVIVVIVCIVLTAFVCGSV